MDKQQALEKAANERGISNGTEAQYIRGFKNGFSDAWDAQQSPSDAVAQVDSEIRAALGQLLDEIPPQTPDADWWHDGLTEAIDRAEKAYFGIKEPSKPSGAAPQATGPVWVKANENCPNTFTDKIVRNIRTKNVYSGFLYKDATTAYFEGRNDDIYVLLTDLEWLDESNTQQVFTWEQVEAAYREGCAYAVNDDNAKSLTEYMNANYPEKT